VHFAYAVPHAEDDIVPPVLADKAEVDVFGRNPFGAPVLIGSDDGERIQQTPLLRCGNEL